MLDSVSTEPSLAAGFVTLGVKASLDPHGLTSAEFVAAARERGFRGREPLEAYRALFRGDDAMPAATLGLAPPPPPAISRTWIEGLTV
ncbi:MAG: hypothetical protein ACO4CI_12575 [Phycisphaerales bacterium]